MAKKKTVTTYEFPGDGSVVRKKTRDMNLLETAVAPGAGVAFSRLQYESEIAFGALLEAGVPFRLASPGTLRPGRGAGTINDGWSATICGKRVIRVSDVDPRTFALKVIFGIIDAGRAPVTRAEAAAGEANPENYVGSDPTQAWVDNPIPGLSEVPDPQTEDSLKTLASIVASDALDAEQEKAAAEALLSSN